MMETPKNYYITTLNPDEQRRRAPLAASTQADVCIVGGGLAGINLALSLAERGRRVVVLEQAHVGAAASGRNAGFVAKGYAAGDLALIGAVGLEKARALVDLTKTARQLIRHRVADYAIDCAPMKDGVLTVSWRDMPQQIEERVKRANDAFDLGFEFWPRLRVRDHCNTEKYYDGIFSPHDFQFNPLKYLVGLARAAEHRGVQIFEDTPATKLVRLGSGGWRVRTPAGMVDAADVVLCGANGMRGLSRRVEGAMVPVRTYIMVTAPIDEALYTRSINTEYAIYDTRFASDYYRRLPEGRLLWGGRVSLFSHPRTIAPLLVKDVLRVYPQLTGHVTADFTWGGVLAYPRHKMPLLAQVKPGLWSNTGFGGHGICPTAVAGEVMATALTTTDEKLRQKALAPFSSFRPGFVGGPVAQAGAQLLYSWWRLRDVLGL